MIWRAIGLRVGYTLGTLAGVVVAWAGLMAFFIALIFAVLIFYAGNTGREHLKAHEFLLRASQVGEGAVFGAGAVALLNAIVRPRPFWIMPMLTGAVLGGVLFFAVPSIPQRIDTTVGPMVRDAWERTKTGEEGVQARAMKFARTQKQVIDLVGENAQTSVMSVQPQKGTPVMYDIQVYGSRTAYAIVNVARSADQVSFTLACVTELHVSQRDRSKHPCERGR